VTYDNEINVVRPHTARDETIESVPTDIKPPCSALYSTYADKCVSLPFLEKTTVVDHLGGCMRKKDREGGSANEF